MSLLIDPVEYYSYIAERIAEKPSAIFLSSYGIYAGILPDGRDTTEWGEKYKSNTRTLLEAMKLVKNVNVLIGLYEYKSCKKSGCIDCEKKYTLDLIRHINHAEKFPEFKWRMIQASHIKCMLFAYPDKTIKGIAGSRNFTDSSWDDLTVVLNEKEIKQLEKHSVAQWNKATVINSDILGEFLKAQGISEEAIESIGNK